jgi:hypothetical protein
MSEVVILVPVLARPDNARPLVRSIHAATEDVAHRILFLVSPGDQRQLKACHDSGVDVLVTDWEGGSRGDYARKINLGYRETTEPWLLMAADDLRFHAGWASEAVAVGERYRVGIVGTNDMGNPRVKRGTTSTHPLIRRFYIDECGGTPDGTGDVLHEGYHHNFCDSELVDVAKARDCWAFAPRSYVEHLHPHWGHGALDDTYRHGLRHFHDDGRLFVQRSRLWTTRRQTARARARDRERRVR